MEEPGGGGLLKQQSPSGKSDELLYYRGW